MRRLPSGHTSVQPSRDIRSESRQSLAREDLFTHGGLDRDLEQLSGDNFD